MSNLNEKDIAEYTSENRNLTILQRILKESEEADEIILWVECPAYQDEVISIKDNDTYDGNDRLIKNITFQFQGMDENSIQNDLIEWNRLVEELSTKEIKLFELKDLYTTYSEKIIAETDFKELYGKNNAEVRKNHIKNELSDIYYDISDLEFSISYITRRISFLKELIRTKQLLIGCEK